MPDKFDQYKKLKFTRDELFLAPYEASEVAVDFWPDYRLEPQQMTEQDRAFIQAALIAAIDASLKAGILFDLWASFVTKAPSKSVQKIVKEFVKKAAKRCFKHLKADQLSTAQVSMVGKAGLLYSWFTTEWRVRVRTQDPSMITNYLAG